MNYAVIACRNMGAIRFEQREMSAVDAEALKKKMEAAGWTAAKVEELKEELKNDRHS